MLDEDVEVLGGIGIERRRQDAAITESARAKLHPPLHPSDNLPLAQHAHSLRKYIVGRAQILKTQFAVFQNLLDFFPAVAWSQQHGVLADALGLLLPLMPHMESSAERSPGIARRRLHKYVLPATAALQELHQQSIVKQAAGQTQILAVARHGQNRILHRALQTVRDRGSQFRWNRGPVVES